MTNGAPRGPRGRGTRRAAWPQARVRGLQALKRPAPRPKSAQMPTARAGWSGGDRANCESATRRSLSRGEQRAAPTFAVKQLERVGGRCRTGTRYDLRSIPEAEVEDSQQMNQSTAWLMSASLRTSSGVDQQCPTNCVDCGQPPPTVACLSVFAEC